ncbi:DUF3080 domain-containing protein [Vibrio sp. SM6]|uniref:DUF3080 domain-containing protein n=1 Tax=Vibrio agarilyticus TaxID=2726741 RepID=A0A7X8TQ81_9VIBR|nr:DUF3080 family protein [Vibrio agarilyticus]NLS12661.1 DUF3080 domain-containing protein [Vibrio agarilyticus]
MIIRVLSHRCRSRILITILPFFLSSCLPFQSEEETRFERYATRLANVFDIKAPATPPLISIKAPSVRDVQITIPRLTLGLLDSYELRHCGLFQLIAEKNSSLGKVQDAFANFDYQLSLTQTLEQCLTEEKNNTSATNPHSLSPKLRSELETLYQTKQQHLQWHWHNLLTSSETMQKQLLGNQWLPDAAFSHRATLSLALTQLREQIDHEQTFIPETVIGLQEAIEKTPLIGPLYFSLIRTTQWLNLASEMVKQEQSNILCGPQRDPTQFQRLNNVFQRYYIEALQPYTAKLDKLYIALSPNIEIIAVAFDSVDQPYPITQAHRQFRVAIKEHVMVWQTLFQRCGHLPELK